MLRDRLVCGIRDKGIQRGLLQDSALTFDEALKVALGAEAADKDARRLTLPTATDKDLFTQKMEPSSAQDTPVHKIGRIIYNIRHLRSIGSTTTCASVVCPRLGLALGCRRSCVLG